MFYLGSLQLQYSQMSTAKTRRGWVSGWRHTVMGTELAPNWPVPDKRGMCWRAGCLGRGRCDFSEARREKSCGGAGAPTVSSSQLQWLQNNGGGAPLPLSGFICCRTQTAPRSTQCWHRAADVQMNCQIASACLPSCISAGRTQGQWEVQPLSVGSTRKDNHTASTPVLHSRPTREEPVCTLNLGGFFSIIPERRGVFVVTAKLNSLLMKGQRRIGHPCGKWMVNTTGSH